MNSTDIKQIAPSLCCDCEVKNVTHKCKNCEFNYCWLCDDCSKLHNRTKAMRSHMVRMHK
jgi:hypothetical protein